MRGGGGCFLERSACLTFWPRGLVLSQGRALLEHGAYLSGVGGLLLEKGTYLTFWPRGWVPFQGRVLLELGELI